ncbi:MAG: hypothetical protein AB8B78_07475 [Polaribacter sp.]
MDTEILHRDWIELSQNYFDNDEVIHSLWNAILTKYTSKSRFYHNLIHISSMLFLAKENKSQIVNYHEVLFAIWFHDIIYKSTSKKNEEKSADFAKLALEKCTHKNINIDKIYQLIISTKSHKIILNDTYDNACLLDFDLSILGQSWHIYESYIQKIRKEYQIYPDFLYNPGRKKVLQYFLNRKSLYFTEKYQNLLETKARENLTRELELL